MIKTKVIKGKPIYILKGSQYIDRPDNTNIKSMMYDEETNLTYVKLSKPNIIMEVLCSIIILFCVLSNIFFVHNSSVNIRYNNIVTYYDNKLYLNLKNEEDSLYKVSYKLVDEGVIINEGYMKPGDSVVSIDIENIKESYKIIFEFNTLTEHKIQEEKIMVLNKSIE